MMLSKQELEIYSRHLMLNNVGRSGQLKLKNSSVLVIGAGGLGCSVLQYLVSAGVGHIGIVDFDVVSKSNLHRQILFDYGSIGKPKVEVAKKRLSGINPFVRIDSEKKRLTASNAIETLSGFDVVVDCTDNLKTRYLINDTCVFQDIPLVYAAIYKFDGQVSVFNLKGGPTYRCMYGEFPKSNSIKNCSETGVLGVLPGIIGSIQASEVIKIILGLGQPLSGKIFMYDSLTCKTRIFQLAKKEHAIYQQIREEGKLFPEDYDEMPCVSRNNNSREVDSKKLEEVVKNGGVLIDVREEGEFPAVSKLHALSIPLGDILERANEISKSDEVVLFCKSGIRSKRAIEILEHEFGFTNLLNLEGGIEAYPEIFELTIK